MQTRISTNRRKVIQSILSVVIASTLANAAAPAVGSVSANQQFARNTGSGFSTANLDDYEGKILILMMMTPWCPICQSNARAVGSGLLGYFDDPSRGSLRNMNDNGVPIQSLLLSNEEAAQWDSVNQSFANTNNFKQWGLDANVQRQNPRELLGYYRGGFINSSNLYDWGNDRRRIVVLNLVKGSASHSFKEIIINQNSFSSSNNSAARAAINRILPEAEVLPPVIELAQGSNQLDTGVSTVSFNNVNLGDASTLTFTMRNSGGSDLTNLAVSVSGLEAADYQVSAPVDATLAATATTSFTVTFRPLAVGIRQATVDITTGAAGVSPFTFNLVGTSGMPAPEVEVHQPAGTILVDGITTRSFGTARVQRRGRTIKFRVFNTGDIDLTNISIAKSGSNPNDFIVRALPLSTLASGEFMDFEVVFQPQRMGTRRASLRLISNDADESPFNIKVTGFGAK